MEILKSHTPVFVDVDGTLIIRGVDPTTPGAFKLSFTFKAEGSSAEITEEVWYGPHTENIELVKSIKRKGSTIIVWTKASQEWAIRIVKQLNLEHYVDYVSCKPFYYFDDLGDTLGFVGPSNNLFIPYDKH